MLPIHQRMAEIYTMSLGRSRTVEEELELNQCLRINADFARKKANLENLSLMASMTNDYDWLHDICRQIDDLEASTQIKKPGPQRGNTDKK